MYTVYSITCAATGRKYFGQTSNYALRVRKHKTQMRGRNHDCYRINNDVRQYGIDTFVFEVLHENLNKFMALALECKYVFEAWDRQDNLLYNVQIPSPMIRDSDDPIAAALLVPVIRRKMELLGDSYYVNKE